MNTLSNFDYSYIDGKFIMSYKHITRELQSWDKEIDNTSLAIANSTNKPIYLCMSGGIDSEVVALSFIKNKIPFIGIIFQHESGTNYYDIVYAHDFCKKYQVNHLIIYLKEYEFFTTGIEKYISQGYQSDTIGKYMQMFIFETVEKLGGCAIICGGEPVFNTINNEICIDRGLGYVPTLEWLKNNNATHHLYFFEHNPEIYASYYKEPLVDLMLKNPDYFRSNYENKSTEKMMIHHKYWPEMRRRPKFNGYEGIDNVRIQSNVKLRGMFPHIQPNWVPVTQIKQQLGV